MSILRKTRLVQILAAIPSDVNSLFLNLGFRLGAAIAGHIISISSTTGFIIPANSKIKKTYANWKDHVNDK